MEHPSRMTASGISMLAFTIRSSAVYSPDGHL